MASQIDCVIPYCHSKTDELRYCLRSLKNINCRRIFICGDEPDFISDKVIYLPRTERGKNRQHDCELNLRLALLDDRLSDDFVYMNDDFFIFKECKELLNYHAGDIDTFISKRQTPMLQRHTKHVMATRDYLLQKGLTDLLSYELHVPMIMNKQKRLELSNEILPLLRRGKVVLPRTIYGNTYYDVSIIMKDVKLYAPTDKIPDTTFISTLDQAFNGNVKSIIESKFKEKSEYER